MCGGRSARAESADQCHDSSITTQSTNHQTRQEVQDVQGRHHESLLVTSPVSLEAAIQTNVFLRGLVEMLVGKHGTFLDVESELEESGEGIGEVTDAEGSDKGGNVSEMGDGGGNQISGGPVDGDDSDPENLSTLGGQWWEIWRNC